MNANRRKLMGSIGELFMLAIALAFLSPMYYLVVNTFKSEEETLRSPFGLPSSLHFEGYRKAFMSMHFFQSFQNTLIITVCSIAFIVLFGALAAYATARKRGKWSSGVTLYFLLGFMIPMQTTVLPLYLILKHLHLVNTLSGIVLLNTNGCVFAFFIFQGFIRTVPLELEESAKMEGCNLWTLFWKVVFPLLKPITLTVVIIQTIWIWNDFINPYLFLSSQKKMTLIVQVYNGVGQFANDWSLMLTTLVLVQLPMVIFYFIMQKRIMAGVMQGAVKT